jgi:hypothetical protein
MLRNYMKCYVSNIPNKLVTYFFENLIIILLLKEISACYRN